VSVTMNVIRDEGKRIPIELARTLYGEIGVAIEKYFEHLTYMEHFGVALCQFNLRPSDSANEYVADCCVLQADVNGKATADFQSAYDRAAIAILMSLCYAFQSYLNESNGLDLQDENGRGVGCCPLEVGGDVGARSLPPGTFARFQSWSDRLCYVFPKYGISTIQFSCGSTHCRIGLDELKMLAQLSSARRNIDDCMLRFSEYKITGARWVDHIFTEKTDCDIHIRVLSDLTKDVSEFCINEIIDGLNLLMKANRSWPKVDTERHELRIIHCEGGERSGFASAALECDKGSKKRLYDMLELIRCILHDPPYAYVWHIADASKETGIKKAEIVRASQCIPLYSDKRYMTVWNMASPSNLIEMLSRWGGLLQRLFDHYGLERINFDCMIQDRRICSLLTLDREALTILRSLQFQTVSPISRVQWRTMIRNSITAA
jgi:hypothetical protein